MSLIHTRPGAYPAFSGWPLSRAMFAEPPPDFRPSVYWFWGREVARPDLLPRMEEMQAAGIPCFWIQARLGYPMADYLSERFFSDYRHCLDQAKRLGLRAGLYDDYNWITGHCAGRTVAGHDHFRERHLFWTEAAAAAGTTVLTVSAIRSLLAEGLQDAWDWMYEGGRMAWGDWQLVRAFGYRVADGEVDPASLVDLSPGARLAAAGDAGCRLEVDWHPPDGSYRVLAFVAARCQTSRLIDYLNPAAIRRFIEVGYEPYWRELGPYFGDPLYAVFLDEPYAGLYSWQERSGEIGTSFMYNEAFFEDFAARHGYDFRDHLYVLIHKAGPQTARLRCDFYAAYSQQAIRGFFGQLSAWCQAHGLPLTGHELVTSLNSAWSLANPRSWFDTLSQFGADHFGIGETKSISCVDSGVYHHSIAAKLGSSIAHTLDKNGTMLEQFSNNLSGGSAAAGNWNLSLQTLRLKADAYVLQGLNKLIFHGFFQSNDVVDGGKALFSQRFDFPPGLNFEPWFPYFRLFSDHNARLSYFLSQGTHVARVAVLYPLRTFWAEATGDMFVPESGFLNEHLARWHYDYDLIDERHLRSGEIRGGQLWVRDEGYSCVVLPAVSTVQDAGTIQALQRLVDAGGTVLAMGRMPARSQAQGVDPAVAAASRELFRSPGAVLLPEPLHALPDGARRLLTVLERLLPRPISIRSGGAEDPQVLHCQRADDTAAYVALLNEGPKDKLVELTVAGAFGVPEIWDPETGAVQEWRYYTPDRDGVTVHLPLEALQTTCVRVPVAPAQGLAVSRAGVPVIAAHADGAGLAVRVRRPAAESAEITLSDGRTVSVAAAPTPPALTLADTWDFRPGAGGAAMTLRSGVGWEVQGLATYAGVGIYSQVVELPAEYLGFDLVLEAEQVCHTLEVEVNGMLCGVRPWAPFRVQLPAGVLRAGPNAVTLRVANTAGNAFYTGTQHERPLVPSGLCGAVRIIPHATADLRVEATT